MPPGRKDNYMQREELAEMLLKRFDMKACMNCQNVLLANVVNKEYEQLLNLPEINTEKKQLEDVFQYVRFGYYSMVCDYAKRNKITPKSDLSDEQIEMLYEYKTLVDSLNKVAKGMGFNIGKEINDSTGVMVTTFGYMSIMNKFFEED